jgi:hypothetical protein
MSTTMTPSSSGAVLLFFFPTGPRYSSSSSSSILMLLVDNLTFAFSFDLGAGLAFGRPAAPFRAAPSREPPRTLVLAVALRAGAAEIC